MIIQDLVKCCVYYYMIRVHVTVLFFKIVLNNIEVVFLEAKLLSVGVCCGVEGGLPPCE